MAAKTPFGVAGGVEERSKPRFDSLDYLGVLAFVCSGCHSSPHPGIARGQSAKSESAFTRKSEQL